MDSIKERKGEERRHIEGGNEVEKEIRRGGEIKGREKRNEIEGENILEEKRAEGMRKEERGGETKGSRKEK